MHIHACVHTCWYTHTYAHAYTHACTHARIWHFAHTTAPPGMQELAGFGHGLPLSRTYARYWGGDISVFSVENWGVDSYIRLGVPSNLHGHETPAWQKRDELHAEARTGVY